MPTWLLRNAKIDEVSLVPKGANRRRFTVFKAHPDIKSMEDNTMPDPKDLKELIESVAEMDDKAKAELRKALALETGDVFEKLTAATDEQKVALRKALGMEPEDDKSLKARVMKLFGLTAEPIDDGLPDAVRKVVDEVKAEVKKAEERADAAEKKLDDAVATIAKRDKAARVQTMVAKAGKYAKMGSPDDISKLLTDAAEKLGDEGLKQVEAVLAKGQEAFEQAKVLDEIGVVNRGEEGGDTPIAKIEAAALEIQKADPKFTIEEARAKAWKDNPKLYDEYQRDRNRAIRTREG